MRNKESENVVVKKQEKFELEQTMLLYIHAPGRSQYNPCRKSLKLGSVVEETIHNNSGGSLHSWKKVKTSTITL